MLGKFSMYCNVEHDAFNWNIKFSLYPNGRSSVTAYRSDRAIILYSDIPAHYDAIAGILPEDCWPVFAVKHQTQNKNQERLF